MAAAAKRAASRPELTIQTLEVGPQLAQEWLDTALPNRRLISAVVERYADQIKAGHWQLNGETIKFDIDGHLADGRHRLTAIVETGVTLPLLIVWGVPKGSQYTVDTGTARTASHVLTMLGEAYTTALAGAIRLLAQYDPATGRFAKHIGSRIYVANQDVKRILDRHPKLRESVAPTTSAWALCGAANAVGFHYLFHRVSDREQADAFFRQVGDGAGLSKSSSVYWLRERLVGSKLSIKEKLRPIAKRDLILKAWLKRDESVSHLRLQPNEELVLLPEGVTGRAWF